MTTTPHPDTPGPRTTAPDVRADLAPEADRIEQTLPVERAPDDDETTLGDGSWLVDPADAAEQSRAVPDDEDHPRDTEDDPRAG